VSSMSGDSSSVDLTDLRMVRFGFARFSRTDYCAVLDRSLIYSEFIQLAILSFFA